MADADSMQRDLIKALNGIRSEIHAARGAKQATKNTQGQPPLVVQVVPDPNLPVAIAKYCESEERQRKARWPKIKAGIEIIGFVIAIVLALLNYRMLDEIRKQTPAIAEATRTAKEDMLRSHRPWAYIPVENGLKTIMPLTFDPTSEYAVTKVVMSMKNSGNSPALSAYLEHRLIVDRQESLLPDLRAVRECEKGDVEQMTKVAGLFLAPGDAYTDEDGPIRNSGSFPKDALVGALLQVCLGYRDEFGGVHATASVWTYQPAAGVSFQPKGRIEGKWLRFGAYNTAY